MKKIKIKKFFDYPFESSFDIRFRDILVQNTEFLHPRPLYILMMVALVILSFFKIQAISFLLAFICLYLYSKALSQKLQKAINIKRDFKNKTKEERIETIEYQFSNPYNVDFYNMLVFDQFEGHADYDRLTHYHYFFPKFDRNKRKKIKRIISLNNGMGLKQLGPFELQFQDSLGLNKFIYTNPQVESVQVFPKVYPTVAPEVIPFMESVEFGLYDAHKRGENVNFYSTREYVPGDNIKKINWKLSLKGQKLIVNEFENNTNSTIEIVVIDDSRIHLGEGSFSTFEYCKDFALSMFHSQIKTHNKVGFHSYQKNIQPRSGRKHLNAIELMVAKHELKVFPASSLHNINRKAPLEVLALRKLLKISTTQDSNIFIFTAILPGKLWRYYLDCFKMLSQKSNKIHLVVIDGVASVLEEMSNSEKPILLHFLQELPAAKNQLEELCRDNNINLHYIEVSNHIEYRETIKNVYKQH